MKASLLLILIVLCTRLLAGSPVKNTLDSSTKVFEQGNNKLVVYTDVPGLAPSDKYTIRVRSAVTNNEWVEVFAHYTCNKAQELGGVSVPQVDGTILQTTVQHYAKHTSAWSNSYANIEMSSNTPV